MLTSKHKCYSILFNLQNEGIDISNELNEVRVENTVSEGAIGSGQLF